MVGRIAFDRMGCDGRCLEQTLKKKVDGLRGKESRPFQTGRPDEAHCFFRLIKCGNWPVGYFIYGEGAKLLLSLSMKLQI